MIRWSPPPPLWDCCKPPTRLERIIWRILGLFNRKKIKPFPDRTGFPIVKVPFPELTANDIVGVQPMIREEDKQG
jgi:hypothetical protein